MRDTDNRSSRPANSTPGLWSGIESPLEMPLKPIAKALRISALGIGFGLVNSASQAATLTVTSGSDIGFGCNLRDAIVSVNTATPDANCPAVGAFGTDDTIVFGGELSSGGSINLNASQLYLANGQTLTIDASAVSGVTIVAAANSRVIEVNNTANLTINNLTITGGSINGSGGGIKVGENAALTVSDCTISNNSGAPFGGGIMGKYGSNIEVENSTISNNVAGDDGGAIYSDSGSIQLDETLITSNFAMTDEGGGIWSNGGGNNSLVIENSQITGNFSATEGGGIYTTGNMNVTLYNSSVSGNVSGLGGNDGNGGGIAIVNNNQYAFIVESTISNNTATGTNSKGGGIFTSGGEVAGEMGAPPTIEPVSLGLFNSTVSGNTAASGGGVSADKTFNYSKYLTVSDNQSTGNGGGVQLEQSTFITFGANITENSAGQNGGGVYADEKSVALILPKYANPSMGATQSSIVSNNTATVSGGGLFLAAGSGSESATISIGPFGGEANFIAASTISGNSSGQQGGGVYQGGYGATTGYAGRLYVDSSTISNNLAGSENATSPNANGGGLALAPNAQLSLVNSTVSGNQASGWRGGGGLFSSQAYAAISNSTFSDNTAGIPNNLKYGGGINAYGGEMDITNSIIANSTGTNDCNKYGGVGFNIDSNSIVEDGSCFSSRSGDPRLGALADNGGPTQTHLPQQSSIAIDSGDNMTCESEDQRGEDRDNDIEDVCDVGAVEFVEGDIDDTSFFVIPLPNGKVVVFSL